MIINKYILFCQHSTVTCLPMPAWQIGGARKILQTAIEQEVVEYIG